jgi:hypothetical protein
MDDDENDSEKNLHGCLMPLAGTVTQIVPTERASLDEDGRIIKSANTTPRPRFRERRLKD